MNHGFTVDSQTLPKGVIETHVSLFDGSNCGIRMAERPVFSVQYHPEATPDHRDSVYLSSGFAAAMDAPRADVGRRNSALTAPLQGWAPGCESGGHACASAGNAGRRMGGVLPFRPILRANGPMRP